MRLSTQSQMGGDRVKAQIVAMTRELRQARPVPPPMAEPSIQSAEVANATWVILRPGTMQPLEAESDNRIIIQAADGKKEEIQTRHFKFDWK